MKQLIAASSPSSNESSRRIAPRQLAHLQKSLESITSVICFLRQYEERTNDINKDLVKTTCTEWSSLMTTNSLNSRTHSKARYLRNCCPLFLAPLYLYTTSSSDSSGVKLPKLDVPTFDGNILNWRAFWEQFSVSVHDRAMLSHSEKLVYLQQSLKGGSAKGMIEGLSRSGECYVEAIECLRSRYNRPRFIHQAHVRVILEVPSLKEGSGRSCNTFTTLYNST